MLVFYIKWLYFGHNKKNSNRKKGVSDMKLGTVGTGFIAQEVLPQLRDWGIEPTAVAGTPQTMDEVHKLCDENSIGQAFDDYGKMLSEGDIDTVYVAVPNFLHYAFTKQALLAGKHVIVEKPMTSNEREAKELADLAKEKGLFLFEAITTVYLPNFTKIRELLPQIGDIKIVNCNYSQYSRRYDEFQKGNVLPAFDPKKSGGALMDLNLYNIHYILGLFGEPEAVQYLPNIERGIDTSGILTLDYGAFKAVSIAAKDCAAPANYVIQGTKGYIRQTTPANFCLEITLHLNDGTETTFNEEPKSRLEPEFKAFVKAIDEKDTAYCYERLSHSLAVSKVQTTARVEAGIHFPADEQ